MQKFSYSGYRFPPEIIQQAIWLYLRFTLSLRDVEDLSADRGVPVSLSPVMAKGVQRAARLRNKARVLVVNDEIGAL
jgi:transposase-like protein